MSKNRIILACSIINQVNSSLFKFITKRLKDIPITLVVRKNYEGKSF